ncbi:hypothetical protein HYDPIDRAFT_166773 [Hydnomerulius pinastri MD-312]|nr:hypothetical protein HYDPIDRAFT_166773 [Hydnomerulius pinastri MD-312]
MLHLLPAEIALDAISYLPLQSLHNCASVSRDWNALITINETTVYRNAALLHRFVFEDKLETDSTSQNPNITGIDWKSYCQRQLQIERGWRGKAPSTVKELTSTGTAVHRIKVDDEHGHVITTCQTGGLFVTDLKDNRVLWALPSSHVVDYAHCEFDHGYIIFNRHDSCKEVWRRSIDVDDDQVSQACPPDQRMLAASSQASAKFYSTAGRGHFRAWALVQMPENTRAFRFSYPTLLASGANNAYLWDVEKSEMVETIRDTQQTRNGAIMGSINYVEVDDHYAFICGSLQMRIFAREGGALVYHLSTAQLSTLSWDVLPSSESGGTSSSILEPQKLQQSYHVPNAERNGEFMALHVSSSGKDIAILTSAGRLVIIPGFERLFTRKATLEDIAIQLAFPDFSIYLALGEHNGKIAVATRKGLYVVSPDIEFSRLAAEYQPKPNVSVCQLSIFDNERVLSFISCLQITHSAIFFNYRPSQRNGSRGNVQHPFGNGPGHGLGGVMTTNGLNAMHAAHQPNGVNLGDAVEGSDEEMPGLEPASLHPGEEMDDEDDEPPMPAYEEDDEDEDDFFADEDVAGNGFVQVDGGNDGNYLSAQWEVGSQYSPGAMHILINDWFLPINMSTVFRVSF